VIPPWKAEEDALRASGRAEGGPGRRLVINPGAGFGTGTHETTRLCLMCVGLACTEWAQTPGGVSARRVLDFGSGSGILAVAAASRGATAHGVEIDPLANDNATENASLNDVSERVHFWLALEPGIHDGPYDLVLANILRPVLIEFCSELTARVRREGGVLALSGLVEPDVAPVTTVYRQSFASRGIRFAEEVMMDGEWRCIRYRTLP
jgi:ribosomal protein L11 methyltransferase